MFNLLKNNTDIPLHASTQLTAHNVSEVMALEDMGFNRVVLSREMSFREIERVIERTDVEIEVFIHGALCMCVSGQCYFSSALGSRSGNRGLCAGVCRLPFYVKDKGNYDLSLKDLSHIDYIKNLSDIGVKSFKIEGRMKLKEYVYTVVDEIRKSIEGEYDKEKLKKTFSRNGFTDGYYTGKRTGMFGTKSEKSEVDINFKEKEDKSKVEIDMFYSFFEDKKARLSLKDLEGNEVSVSGEVVKSAINAPLDKEKVQGSLLKLNDSAYFVNTIDGGISKNAFLPIKDINALRRKAVGELDKIRGKREYSFYDRDIKLIKGKSDKKRGENIALFSNINKITDDALLFFDKIFIPLFQIDKIGDIDVKKMGVILPRVYFEDEKRIRKYLIKAKDKGVRYAYCNGLGKANISIQEGFEIYLGAMNNITNSYALNFISENIKNVKNITVSFENTFNNVNKLLSDVPLSVMVYGYMPLMITRNCPVKNEMRCEECKGKSYLTDRMGKRFRVRCENNISSIYNSVPICVFDRMDKLNDNISRVFMFNLDDDVDMVTDRFRRKENVDNFTRGCYFRKLD